MKRVFVLALTVLMLAGCSSQQNPSESTATTVPATTAAPETTAVTETETQPETTDAALTPIYANQIADGAYEITVNSSSSMFKVVKCMLNVKDGAMTATMTMSGQGYGKVYMGTPDEALADTEENYIPFEVDAEGMKEFTVPVDALDMPINCAAWSIKKEKWYDRVLVFESTQLPADAITVE